MLNPPETVTLMRTLFPVAGRALDEYAERWGSPSDPESAFDPVTPDGPALHLIMGDVLSPSVIIPALMNGRPDLSELATIFTFLEVLAVSGDRAVINALQLTTLERIGDHEDWLIRAREFMGHNTRSLSDAAENALGRIH